MMSEELGPQQFYAIRGVVTITDDWLIYTRHNSETERIRAAQRRPATLKGRFLLVFLGVWILLIAIGVEFLPMLIVGAAQPQQISTSTAVLAFLALFCFVLVPFANDFIVPVAIYRPSIQACVYSNKGFSTSRYRLEIVYADAKGKTRKRFIGLYNPKNALVGNQTQWALQCLQQEGLLKGA